MDTDARFALIGKRSRRDYVGARSFYFFKLLDRLGIQAVVYDVDRMTPASISDTTHVVCLVWVNTLEPGLLDFVENLSGRKHLWTEEINWYQECRARILDEHQRDLEESFDSICFSTPQDEWGDSMLRTRYQTWTPMVDERFVPHGEKVDSIFIDALWPEQWASGSYNARPQIEASIPLLKAELGVRIVTQPMHDGHVPTWADDVIDPNSELEHVLSVYSRCLAWVSTHHELLGLGMCEAQVAGTPVVCADEHASLSVRRPGGLVTWRLSDTKHEPDDPMDRYVAGPRDGVDSLPTPEERFAAAMRAAVSIGRSGLECERLRARAIEAFGLDGWTERILRRIL